MTFVNFDSTIVIQNLKTVLNKGYINQPIWSGEVESKLLHEDWVQIWA
jgi:hypothetical protein